MSCVVEYTGGGEVGYGRALEKDGISTEKRVCWWIAEEAMDEATGREQVPWSVSISSSPPLWTSSAGLRLAFEASASK